MFYPSLIPGVSPRYCDPSELRQPRRSPEDMGSSCTCRSGSRRPSQALIVLYCAVPGSVLEPKWLRRLRSLHSRMAVQFGRLKTGQCRWDDCRRDDDNEHACHRTWDDGADGCRCTRGDNGAQECQRTRKSMRMDVGATGCQKKRGDDDEDD